MIIEASLAARLANAKLMAVSFALRPREAAPAAT